jgi:hypothetical protein
VAPIQGRSWGEGKYCGLPGQATAKSAAQNSLNKTFMDLKILSYLSKYKENR